MAEMGLGYGSEFQLLRFLGHHREELDALIQNSTGVLEPIHWLDYPYNKERKSGDGELTGIECFQHLDNYQDIQEKWESFWPQGGSSMNWDGIFVLDGVWYFVEAKANKREAYQHCKAKSVESRKQIDCAMNSTKEWLGIDNKINWRRTNCYQFANRLVFAFFCNKVCHIPARILYVGFLNGFGYYSIERPSDWEAIWNAEYEILGIDETKLQGILYHIYPDCRQ